MVLFDRRHALGLLGASALFGPRLAHARGTRPRALVLVELKGGNDGLNTLVPYRDEAYRRLRPQLGLHRDEVIPLDAASGMALHGALAPLMPAFTDGSLAVVQGVGYPKPNRSHFRSIDIWNAASASDEVKSRGWLADLGRANDLGESSGPLFALNLAPTGPGPLTGTTSMLTLPRSGPPPPPRPPRPPGSAVRVPPKRCSTWCARKPASSMRPRTRAPHWRKGPPTSMPKRLAAGASAKTWPASPR